MNNFLFVVFIAFEVFLMDVFLDISLLNQSLGTLLLAFIYIIFQKSMLISYASFITTWQAHIIAI